METTQLAAKRIVKQMMRNPRYIFASQVDTFSAGVRHGTGKLINMSCDGVAFTSYTPLIIAENYTVIIKSLGSYSCKIVRKFNSHGYGATVVLDYAARDFLKKQLAEIGNLELED